MPGLSILLIYGFLVIIPYIQLTTSINTDTLYDDNDQTPRCEPMCRTGYFCELRNGQSVCVFAKSVIVVIVVLTLLGILAIAAGLSVLTLCFCAAFKQESLNRILRKRPSQVEREIKKRNERKRRPISATYFDDELQRRRAENASLDTSATTVHSVYAMGPPPPMTPRTPQAPPDGGDTVAVGAAPNGKPGQDASPPRSVLIMDAMIRPQGNSATRTRKTRSNKSEDTASCDKK